MDTVHSALEAIERKFNDAIDEVSQAVRGFDLDDVNPSNIFKRYITLPTEDHGENTDFSRLVVIADRAEGGGASSSSPSASPRPSRSRAVPHSAPDNDDADVVAGPSSDVVMNGSSAPMRVAYRNYIEDSPNVVVTDRGQSMFRWKESVGGDKDMSFFVTRTPPKGVRIQCHVRCMTSGLANLLPEYHLFSEDNSFMLAAQKELSIIGSSFEIATDVEPRFEQSIVASLKSNFMKSEHTIVDETSGAAAVELGAVVHEDHLWSEIKEMLKGIPDEDIPYGRTTTVLIPPFDNDGTAIRRRGAPELLELYEAEDFSSVVRLVSKKPVWDPESKSFTLSFQGRATLSSTTNFQIIDPKSQNNILLAFGRVEENVWTLDYCYPFTALQAFGVALSVLV
eukprot:tig00000980_g6128.t1